MLFRSGADSIGGAINLVADIDYVNRMLVMGQNNSKTIQGNYIKIINLLLTSNFTALSNQVDVRKNYPHPCRQCREYVS